uniref:Uncharacterized protein n=1 Tax=Timema cristinae TaxID=61476 RepID=A0A7R9CBI2_TIMCR|nr:unnamed protein product [Timema cristinae]
MRVKHRENGTAFIFMLIKTPSRVCQCRTRPGVPTFETRIPATTRQNPLSLLTVNCLFQVPGKVWSLNHLDEAEVRMLETDLDAEDEDKWWSHLPLSSLDLSSNALKVIPANIKHLDTLTVLNACEKKLPRRRIDREREGLL